MTPGQYHTGRRERQATGTQPKSVTPVGSHHETVCGYTTSSDAGPVFVWQCDRFKLTATSTHVSLAPHPLPHREQIVLVNSGEADRLVALIELADSVRRELAKSRTRKTVDAVIHRLQTLSAASAKPTSRRPLR